MTDTRPYAAVSAIAMKMPLMNMSGRRTRFRTIITLGGVSAFTVEISMPIVAMQRLPRTSARISAA